jgi:hypothetical protein
MLQLLHVSTFELVSNANSLQCSDWSYRHFYGGYFDGWPSHYSCR